MKSKNVTDFFKEVKIFKEKQKEQKQKGLNDYNLLTSVLKSHDEVRLHSRVIGSLLDVDGLHYQEDFFLEEFLRTLNYLDFDFKTKKSSIKLEYENIDLYLTDGSKHIIIENKIYAGDQHNQIKRYIDIVNSENEDLNYSDILVIYLSIDRKKPSKYSLSDNLKIKDDLIVDKDGQPITLYRTMHYKTEIIQWLNKCKSEMQNITNLHESISQYLTVVEKITKKYKPKVGSLKTIIMESAENLEIASEIYGNFIKVQEQIVKEFFTENLIEQFQKRLDDSSKYKNYKIEVYEKNLNDKRSYPIRITHKEKNWKIIFQFGFDTKNMNSGYYGISKYSEKTPLEEFRNIKYPMLNELEKSTSWSILWDYSPRRYSYDIKNLIDFKYNTNDVVEEYFSVFKKSLEQLEKYNLSLDELNSELELFLLKK